MIDQPVLIMSDIGGEFDGGYSARMLEEDLHVRNGAKQIVIRVNSPGGVAADGISMFNTIRNHPARIIVEVMGMAASAAHLLAMGADEIVMKKGSLAMMHLPHGLTVGNAADMRKTAAVLDKMTEQIVSIYKTRSRKRDETIMRMLEEETWFGPEEAVAAGFADRVDNEPAIKNKIDAGRFLNCPREWIAESDNTEPPKLSNPWRSRAARRAESLQF